MEQNNNNNVIFQMSNERAVQQILAQYVRAADALDGRQLSNLFTTDGKVAAGTIGLKGTVIPTESGYYKPSLKKVNGEWKITIHRIYHDLTFAITGK